MDENPLVSHSDPSPSAPVATSGSDAVCDVQDRAWTCPFCGSGNEGVNGIYCECEGLAQDLSGDDHGTHAGNPCPHAVCYGCGWEGWLPRNDAERTGPNPEPLTPAQREELSRLCREATPGPVTEHTYLALAAAARSAVPRLLAALDAMTQEREAMVCEVERRVLEIGLACKVQSDLRARLARVAALAAQWEEHISGGASPAWEACARALRAALEETPGG